MLSAPKHLQPHQTHAPSFHHSIYGSISLSLSLIFIFCIFFFVLKITENLVAHKLQLMCLVRCFILRILKLSYSTTKVIGFSMLILHRFGWVNRSQTGTARFWAQLIYMASKRGRFLRLAAGPYLDIYIYIDLSN